MGIRWVGIMKLWVFLGADPTKAGALILAKLTLLSVRWVVPVTLECSPRPRRTDGWCRLRQWHPKCMLLLGNPPLDLPLRVAEIRNGRVLVPVRTLTALVIILTPLAVRRAPLPLLGCRCILLATRTMNLSCSGWVTLLLQTMIRMRLAEL